MDLGYNGERYRRTIYTGSACCDHGRHIDIDDSGCLECERMWLAEQLPLAQERVAAIRAAIDMPSPDPLTTALSMIQAEVDRLNGMLREAGAPVYVAVSEGAEYFDFKDTETRGLIEWHIPAEAEAAVERYCGEGRK